MYQGKRFVEVSQLREIQEVRSILIDTGEQEVSPAELDELIHDSDVEWEFDDEDIDTEIASTDEADPECVDITIEEEEESEIVKLRAENQHLKQQLGRGSSDV